MEVWKDIDGYEGDYQISTYGRVRSIKTKTYIYQDENHMLKPRYNSNGGYAKVALYKDNKRKQMFIHRLVALAFIPIIKDKTLINHKNGIKDDNRVENLEWCDNSENINHAINNGLKPSSKGSQHGMSKLNEEQVLKMRQEHESGIHYSILAKKYKVSRSTTYAILVSKKLWRHLLNGGIING